MLKKSALKETDVNTRIVEEVLSQTETSELFGKDGMFNQLKKQIVEKLLEKELDHELGYSKNSKVPKVDSNHRNGSYDKTVIDDQGHKLSIEVSKV